jgi:PrtD family type I secretion system ABC transporter
MSVSPLPTKSQGPLGAALSSVRHAFVAVSGLSGLLNILTLAGSFFMLLVYDRVLPSRSLPTLVGLVLLVGTIYIFQALLEFIRSRILVEIGAALDTSLSRRTYEIILQMRLKTRAAGDGLQPIRDLDQVRGFMSGPGPTALFDLPWIFLYLGICFMFHWLIGVTALAGAAVLIGLTFLTEHLTREPAKNATRLAGQRSQMIASSVQNAEVLHAMGMGERMQLSWAEASADYIRGQKRAADLAGGLGAFTRVFRMFLQSGVLAVGAYLVVEQKATGGIIIASSILTSRSLAPVELAIANWKGFVAARQAWGRLNQLLEKFPAQPAPTSLPPPGKTLSLEGVSVAPPGGARMTAQDVSFGLKAGMGLGVIGPSGSGKSSLIRAIVGVWPIHRGVVRIDGATLEQWSPTRLGEHIGYLPQDVELLTGTVAQNIARFDTTASSDEIIAAASSADVHELILRLPQGYETPVGQNGAELSAGQRQRIALARALFRAPFLVVLDEPNSNLDSDGEIALARAIASCRNRGAIVIVVAHRQSALQPLDQVALMADGRLQIIGPKDEVLAKVLAASNASPAAQRPPNAQPAA